jgi:acetylornithine aminotransferase/acetylornithine/N-succinyldiaminopimelate aminotransferase
LRELCTKNNLLLLIDEVQCGIGRTGKFYAYEHAGIQPDAIGMAKGLGGGFPIGSMWVRENAAELFHPGSHGTTFGGTPLACAAALAVLDVIERDQLVVKVAANSVGWYAALNQLVKDFPAQLLGVRGLGYLVGVQFASDIAPYQAALREAGLLVPAAGGNVIRLLPPLTAPPEELAQATEILRKVLATKA